MGRGGIIWLTGIPAAGKTTFAKALALRMRSRGSPTEILDGDEVGNTQSSELGFSRADQDEKVRQVGAEARRLAQGGVWIIVTLVSPFRAHREAVRQSSRIEGIPFVETLAKCSVEEAERRDTKGLYRKARLGEIEHLAGVSDPYEEPTDPDVVIDMENEPMGLRIVKVISAASVAIGTPPIILMGKGGSGTRLLADLARSQGLFVGVCLDESNDSFEMRDLIHMLVQETVGEPALSDGGQFKEEIKNTLRGFIARAPGPLGAPWGWKIPETMLILPIFIHFFPNAKVVHMVRNPLSSSLNQAPHDTAKWIHPLGRSVLKRAYPYCGRDLALLKTDEDWMRNACSWQFQVSRVVQYGRDVLGPSRYREMKYEDLCEHPQRYAKEFSEFVGLEERPWHPIIDRARMNPWHKDDPRIWEVWRICNRTAELLGYERPPGDAFHEH
jgi:adenylylsulfate kinase